MYLFEEKFQIIWLYERRNTYRKLETTIDISRHYTYHDPGWLSNLASHHQNHLPSP